jgi:hypothetical protein
VLTTRVRAVISAVLCAAAVLMVVPSETAAEVRPPFAPPVHAPVADPYRPPVGPYDAGNRGIDYATIPGTLVGAAGAGVVQFAGEIAGQLYVTILHEGGVRTSYSYLAAITVVVGQPVQLGQTIGVAGPDLQVGARIGRTYIDPAGLWGGPPHVFLVPLADGGGAETTPRTYLPAVRAPTTTTRAQRAAPTPDRPVGRGAWRHF